jgi:PAS domain S-box-containing protein
MPSESHRSTASHRQTFAAGLLLIALGAAALLGWAFGIATLRSVLPNLPFMKVNTALAMIFCGVALALLSQRQPPKIARALATTLAVLVGAIGAFTLMEYLFGWNLVLDQLLFHQAASQTIPGYCGRMAPASALCFVFASIALFLCSMGNGPRWRWPLVTALGAAISAMAAMVLAGYLVNALLHTNLSIYPEVALNSAVGFFFLGIALLSMAYSVGQLTWSFAPWPTRAILFGIAFLLLVALLSNTLTVQLQQDHQWVSHTQEVLREIDFVTRSAGDLFSAPRSYLVSADERLLAQRTRSQATVRDHLATLRRLTADNANQQRRINQLEPLIAQRDLLWNQLIAARRQAGPNAAALQPLMASENAVGNEMRALVKDMRDDEYSLFDRRSAQTDTSAGRAFLLLPLGLLLTLTVLSVALFFLNAGVTEQHQTERELLSANEKIRSSEAYLRLMVSGVKDYAIFMLDPNGLVASWNLGAQRLKGWNEEEIVGQHFSRFYSQEEIAANLPQRELQIAKSAGQFASEGWRLRKDGSHFWANVLITPVRGSDGLLVGFSKITRDTTEQRRIEQAMKDEEARLAAVIGSAMDAVITVDEQQLITLFNPAAERMFGYGAEAVMGTSLEQLIPTRFRGSHGSHIRGFAQTNATRRKMGALTPIYGLRSNGEEFPIEASISQANVSGQKVFSVILRDVSERNRSEEVLRQHASLLDVAPVLVRDMDDRIVFWSAGLTKLYNFSRMEAEGRISHEVLQTQFPEPLEQIKHTLHSSGIWEGELHHRDRDGNKVVVNSQWVLTRDSQGNPMRILELNADITAKKRAEALQLRSQKLESLGTLSGGIAHDFNNILLAITGNAKLAIADLPREHPVQQSLAEIAKAGVRATDLVRRILTFSRPGEIKRHILELQPVVEEALKLVRATLPATIDFRTSFAPNLPTVLADSTQIHQIIVNLATNAAHAIGRKSDGVIEVRLEAARLTADDASPGLNLPEGSYVRLFISDNGCGMDRATLDRIYDPFFTTKAPGEGTGLGLSVVHGIMKNHDGGIAVYSEPQRGTAFRLFFPAAGLAPAAVPEAHSEVQRQSTEKILYVDDEESLVILVTRTLERLGYKVTGEANSVRALELFRSNPAAFDAVVTDLAMPQLSGFDLATQLLAVRPNIPIVMTSGYVRPEDQERALNMGIRDLILKPDTIEQLGRTLARLLNDQPVASPQPADS